MRKIIMAMFVTSSLNCAAIAQVGSGFAAPSTMHGKTVALPRGTTLEGRLDRTIGSRFSHPGDRFTISMSSPVLGNGTDVLIPAGSLIIGEVVEAIASEHQEIPKGTPKGTPKPLGKLRIQLTGLRTPDGITYPLVASLVGEAASRTRGNQQSNNRLGGGVGYVGTQASFEAVAPGVQDRARNGGGAKLMSRDEVLNDPIYGGGSDRNDSSANGGLNIRSLVKRGRDLMIAVGSPVSIRLDAACKIGIPQAPGAEATLIPTVNLAPDGSIGRRFSKTALPDPTIRQNPGEMPENPLPGILPDVPHTMTPPQTQQAPVVQPMQQPQSALPSPSSKPSDF